VIDRDGGGAESGGCESGDDSGADVMVGED